MSVGQRLVAWQPPAHRVLRLVGAMIPPVSPLFYFPQVAATELLPELRAAEPPEYAAAGSADVDPEILQPALFDKSLRMLPRTGQVYSPRPQARFGGYPPPGQLLDRRA